MKQLAVGTEKENLYFSSLCFASELIKCLGLEKVIAI